MKFKVPHLVTTYKKVALTPIPISAVILPGTKQNTLVIHSQWKYSDVIKEQKSIIERNYVVQEIDTKFDVLFQGIPDADSCGSLESFSPSSQKRAIMTSLKSSDDQFIEIWGSRKEKTFDLRKRKEHGKIHEHDMFNLLEWSSDEKYLLYTAEKKVPQSETYFKDPSVTDESKDTVKGQEFMYQQSWGEVYTSVYHTVLCILNTETGHIEVVDTEELKISVSEALWGPSDKTIVFVGWSEQPRKLGLVYCANRRSAIYYYDLETKKIECLSGDGDTCALSPRFNPKLDTLIYLENPAGGPHKHCSKIMKCEWGTKKITTLVNRVHEAIATDFPGIYTLLLPHRCWSGEYILLTSVWRSQEVILCVNAESGEVQRLSLDDKFGGCDVLDVKGNIVVASVSSPSLEPCMIVGFLNKTEGLSLNWTYLNEPCELKEITWNITTLTPLSKNEKYPNLDYEIIVIMPKEKQSQAPVIIWPHGGPHSAFTANFSILCSAFVSFGFIVCMVNYRGSIGFGQNSIDSLPGNVGVQDVLDVHHASEYLKEKVSDVGPMILFGGSHGGFLVTHLSGQYPDYYKICIARNPVIDMTGLVEVSDIPDWAWCEAGIADMFNFSAVPKPEILTKMFDRSPIKYIENVKAPTLLILGKYDLRVPYSQGLKYYYILKARNVPVSAYLYNDNHSLSKIEAASDGFMQIMLWIEKHLE